MKLEEAILHIKSLLEKRGYCVKLKKINDNEYRLNINKENKKAEIRVVGRENLIKQLYIKHGGQLGMSILSCENFKEVAQCIEEVVKVL